MLLPVLLLMASPAKTATPVAGLDARLAAWRRVKMGPGAEGIDAADRKVVLKLVEAARYMESIFWRFEGAVDDFIPVTISARTEQFRDAAFPFRSELNCHGNACHRQAARAGA